MEAVATRTGGQLSRFFAFFILSARARARARQPVLVTVATVAVAVAVAVKWTSRLKMIYMKNEQCISFASSSHEARHFEKLSLLYFWFNARLGMACIQQLLFRILLLFAGECAAEARARRKGRRKGRQQKLTHAFDRLKLQKQRKYQNFGA